MPQPVPYIDATAIEFFVTDDEVSRLKVDLKRNKWFICEVLREVYLFCEKAKKNPENMVLLLDMAQHRVKEATVMAKKMNRELLEWQDYKMKWEKTPLRDKGRDEKELREIILGTRRDRA
jgi:hypothetical protein